MDFSCSPDDSCETINCGVESVEKVPAPTFLRWACEDVLLCVGVFPSENKNKTDSSRPLITWKVCRFPDRHPFPWAWITHAFYVLLV